MLNVVYNQLDDPDVQVKFARCTLPLFGRWCQLNITSYCHAGGTAITFGFEPSSWHPPNNSEATLKGTIALTRGSGGNRQQFEQAVTVPRLIGQLLDWSELEDGGTPAGRTISAAIRRRTESIVETVRQHIRRHLGKDSKEQSLAMLNDRYGKSTYEGIRSFLGEINWRFMLDGSGLDNDAADVIDHTLENTPIRVYRITKTDDTPIPLIAYFPADRFNHTTLANLKATTLLRKVCGDEIGDKFDKTGKVIIYQHDYRFEIKPGAFVEVSDPNGKTARLCIHTARMSCNPIDEVCISYLHIRNKFDEWMDMAVVHNAQQGFQRTRKIA